MNKNEINAQKEDTGNSIFQICALTRKINQINEHLNGHKKDYSGHRGLLIMVNRRKRLLAYLYRKDPSLYYKAIEEAGIRK